jgi:cytochrome d ubiquinol oxidase subunit II
VEKFKYLHNFIEMPVVLILFLAGVAGVLYGIGITLFKRSLSGIWFSGAGTVLAVFSLFLVAGFNGTSFYPSLSDLQSSLTIRNASSSLFTLKTMMYVSFIIPLVLGYIWYAWKAINNSKITEEEMNSEEHKY